MIFSTPLAAFGLLTAVGLAAVYCFRRKSPPRPVSSLLLWPPAKSATAESTRRDRLRTPPIFWLELLVLLALVDAALSPLAWRRSEGTLHVVLDTSASMHADASRPATTAADFLANERRRGAKDAVRVKEAASAAALDRELAAAESIRAPGDEILVLTDHAPAAPLRPGVRWEAFGAPLANTAFTACRRRRAENGADSIFLEVRRFGSADGSTRFVTLSSPTDAVRPVSRTLAFDTNGLARVTLDVPAVRGPLVAKLSDDALADDNEITLPAPDVPSLFVHVSVTNDALRALVKRALKATGCVREETAVENAEFIVADREPRGVPAPKAFTLRFHPSGGKPVSEPVWVDPSEALTDGIGLDGDPYALTSEALPGRPVAFIGTVPLVSVDTNALHLAFSAPELPFFRSPSFPALIENAALAAHRLQHPKSAQETEKNLLDVGESDLTGAVTLSTGTRASAPEDVRRTKSVAWIFALVALAALGAHFALVRKRPTAVLMALVALALLRPVLPLSENEGTLLVLADRSRSMGGEALKEQESVIRSLAASRPGSAQLGVIAFGETAAVEARPGGAGFGEFVQDPGADASDVAAALFRAESLTDDPAATRCLVLSDGLFTGPQPSHPAFPVDACLETRPYAHDLAMTEVSAPAEVAARAVIPITAWVSSEETVTNRYTLTCGTNVVCRGTSVFRKGLTPLVMRDFATGTGLRRYALTVGPATDDPCRENNTAKFLVKVTGRKPLLWILSEPTPAADAVKRAGVPVEVREAKSFSGDLGTLTESSGVILENVPANALGSAFVRDLAAYVTDYGGALALTGGEKAFGQGGWYKTPVEDILPVSLELRNEHRKYSIALAIVMDRSGSMTCTLGNGKTKMDMANLGAAGAIGMLSGADQVAVIAVDSTPHVVLPMQDADRAQAQISQVLGIRSMGGGIFVEQGLLAGFRELEKSDCDIKHIILFADAADSEEPGDYEKYVGSAAKSGITVSVIGMGSKQDCDAELLEKIAAAGAGECWFEANPNEIPRLFMQDTFLTAKLTMCTNETPLKVLAPVRQLSDTIPAALANAGGYNLVYARETAETAITTEDDEHAPFLAFGRAGLGRTLAFAGELSGKHAAPLMTSPAGAELASSIARWVYGNGETETCGFSLSRRTVPGGFVVTAVADTENMATAVPNSGLPLVTLVERPGEGSVKRVDALKWEDSDVLSGFVPLKGDEIAYPLVMLPNGTHQALAPVMLAYPGEYIRPTDPGVGKRALEALASSGGGTLRTGVEGIWDALPKVRRGFPLAPFIYLFAAVLFLVLVYLRRIGFKSRIHWKLPKLNLPKTPPGTVPSSSGTVPSATESTSDKTPAPAAPTLGSTLAKAKRRAGHL